MRCISFKCIVVSDLFYYHLFVVITRIQRPNDWSFDYSSSVESVLDAVAIEEGGRSALDAPGDDPSDEDIQRTRVIV